MIYQKYIARCYRVYQHERNETASFLSIFNGGWRPKWRFSNFPRFWKNSSALGSFNCIFENNSLKALFGQNMKKLKILKLSPDSRYLQKLALKNVQSVTPEIEHKPFFEGFLIHIPGSYPELILNVLLVFILLSHPLIQHWDMIYSSLSNHKKFPM